MHLLHRPRLRWGGLRGGGPVHPGWGRGEHVDRVYLDRFFAEHAELLTGEVAEIQSPVHTVRHGQGVTGTTVFDLAARDGVDLVADLDVARSLPSGRFDAVVLPQTLQFLPRPDVALATLHDSLRHGGTLLLTAPGLSQTRAASLGPEPDFPDLWRWTADGLRALLGQVFPSATTTVRSWGDLTTTIAFLAGVGAGELFDREIDEDDPRYPLVVSACARRAA